MPPLAAKCSARSGILQSTAKLCERNLLLRTHAGPVDRAVRPLVRLDVPVELVPFPLALRVVAPELGPLLLAEDLPSSPPGKGKT